MAIDDYSWEGPFPDSNCETHFGLIGSAPTEDAATLVVGDDSAVFSATYHHLATSESLRLVSHAPPALLRPGEVIVVENLSPRRVLSDATAVVRFSRDVPEPGGGIREDTLWELQPVLAGEELRAEVPANLAGETLEGNLTIFVEHEPAPVLACSGFSSCGLPPEPSALSVDATYAP